MTRASKYCIFCGAHPTTREHIWAKWLGRFIPKTMKNYSSGSSTLTPTGIDKTNRLVGGDIHGRQLQVVCKHCNETWMSQLQNAAKPILVPLLQQNRALLNGGHQSVLAAWVTMSVICAEYFNPRNAAISITDRRWLYRNRTGAPDSFRIWIGNFERKKWKPRYAHGSLRITEHEGAQGWTFYPDGYPRPNTQTTTFVVGNLFIHAYSCPFPEILGAQKITAALDNKLIQIWPIRHSAITWPTTPINDADADSLTGSIFFRLVAN